MLQAPSSCSGRRHKRTIKFRAVAAIAVTAQRVRLGRRCNMLIRRMSGTYSGVTINDGSDSACATGALIIRAGEQRLRRAGHFDNSPPPPLPLAEQLALLWRGPEPLQVQDQERAAGPLPLPLSGSGGRPPLPPPPRRSNAFCARGGETVSFVMAVPYNERRKQWMNQDTKSGHFYYRQFLL